MTDDVLNHHLSSHGFTIKTGDLLYNEALITDKDGVLEKQTSLSVLQNGTVIEFVHAGGALTIHGGEKAGKGILSSVIAAAWLSGSFGCFSADTGGQSCVAILHSDDVRHGLWRLGMRISKWSGSGDSLHKDLKICEIRTKDLSEKRLILEEVLSKEKVGLLVIDLIWDWLQSVNDESSSKELTDYLLQLCDKYKVILVVVTHESRMSRLAKGHQGAHWTAKSQTVLSVKKRGERFIVTPEHCRGKEFDRMAFQYDGEHVTFLDASELRSRSKQSVTDFDRISDDTHLNILNFIFKEHPNWEATVLRDRLQDEYSKRINSLGINSTKSLLKYYRDKGWLYTEKRRYHFKNGMEHA